MTIVKTNVRNMRLRLIYIIALSLKETNSFFILSSIRSYINTAGTILYYIYPDTQFFNKYILIAFGQLVNICMIFSCNFHIGLRFCFQIELIITQNDLNPKSKTQKNTLTILLLPGEIGTTLREPTKLAARRSERKTP